MYVCICKAVSDRRIRRAVDEGAVSVRDLSRETALGTNCGKCVPQAREILAEALAAKRPFCAHDAAPVPELQAAG
jgi:bacterioferritin-associated ferredoxin